MSNKIRVFKCTCYECRSLGMTTWRVECPGGGGTLFRSHARAVSHADRLAYPTPPPLTAHGARLTDDAARDFREGL